MVTVIIPIPAKCGDELKMLKEKFKFDHIWFCDDIFGLKPGWVNEFADLVEKEDLQFRFKIQARADLLLQEEYIKTLQGLAVKILDGCGERITKNTGCNG